MFVRRDYLLEHVDSNEQNIYSGARKHPVAMISAGSDPRDVYPLPHPFEPVPALLNVSADNNFVKKKGNCVYRTEPTRNPAQLSQEGLLL